MKPELPKEIKPLHRIASSHDDTDPIEPLESYLRARRTLLPESAGEGKKQPR